MIPGRDLELTMSVLGIALGCKFMDVLDDMESYFGRDKAAEILTDLSKDGVLTWCDHWDHTYLVKLYPCAWCGWRPGIGRITHIGHMAAHGDVHGHFYDYRMTRTA